MNTKPLNGNQLKGIALTAMTIDHAAIILYPGYPTDWCIIGLHMIGRLAAPIFWYFVAEGYFRTHDIKKYAGRLFFLAIVSHFAYNFAFGIPFIPFQTSIFNQTSVIWSLAWGLVGLAIHESGRIEQWQKTVLILLITVLTFCADWSSIAVLAIIEIGANRGNFKKQMTLMMMWIFVYAAVYAVFIHPVYGILQLSVALTIPLLKMYNGERGSWKGMKWLFYFYYPAHLFVCGLMRIALYGNVGLIIGG
ncbi:MAG: conjugal transfer protein TraX [Lachnospiraceae bacterium]|nr:conjugal transfer protein TraX [Lachnospiraceae bacterium]